MRLSTIVAFAAGVAVAVPAPEQIILNPQNDTSRQAAHVSKDHESFSKAPPTVVYGIRNLEDGSVPGWKRRENAPHGDELRCTKEKPKRKHWLMTEMARLEENMMYDTYEMQSEEAVLFQYED
ncbi:hypothetical protein MY1884_004755 [Beauveria asiatica]